MELTCPAKANIVAEGDFIIAGLEEAVELFSMLGAKCSLEVKDGDRVGPGQILGVIDGDIRALLSGERVALNIMTSMSDIATFTRELVGLCAQKRSEVKIAATRKTTPGFRHYEKKAVVIGGGDPHRLRLDDGILIKDNHIQAVSSVAECMKRARKNAPFGRKIEIEVEDLENALVAAKEGADIIMRDNFRPADAAAAYKRLKEDHPDVIIEISGGITRETILDYVDAADVISLGALTRPPAVSNIKIEFL